MTNPYIVDPSTRMLPRVWIVFAVMICTVGIFLRFYHLDWKVYSFDETVTSIRASGHSISEFTATVDDGKTHSLRELDRFQHYDSTISTQTMIQSLAKEEPQHPPLYFLAARFISQHGASSIGARRLLAAIFSVLLIPAFWWLTYELYRSHAAAWFSSALVAVSPFHLAYAQQDREYSAWALSIVVTSALLFGALQKPRIDRWVLYALATALSLWLYTLSVYVLIAQLVYVMFFADLRGKEKWSYLVAIGVAIATFTPWLYTIARNAGTVTKTTAWDGAKLPIKILAEKWLFNATAVFFDLDYISLRYLPLVAIVLVIVGLAVAKTIAAGPRKATAFIMLLGTIPALALLVPDLVLGQSHSTQSRYLSPTWIALELAVAYGLANLSGISARQKWRPVFSRAGMLALLGFGLASCIVSSQARYWWIASDVKSIPEIADVLNDKGSGSLIAFAGDDFYLLELSNVVRAPLEFHQNGERDRALQTAGRRIYLIGKPAQVDFANESNQPLRLRAYPLPRVFPQQDASVRNARVEGAVARKSLQTLDDVQLWEIVGRV